MSYSLIGHAEAASSNTTSVTTGSINTTGADLLVVVVADYDSSATMTVTDSKSNTWSSLTASTTTSTPRCRIFYSQGGTVGSGHTFTATGSGGGGAFYPSMCVAAFSGSAASPFDVQNHVDVAASQTSTQPGSITPTQDNELIIAGLAVGADGGTITVNSSMTIYTQAYVGGNAMGSSLAWKTQTSATAINPTFSTNSVSTSAVIASFKAGAGGGTPPAVTSIAPTYGVVDPTYNYIVKSVVITGTDFATGGGTTVTFSGSGVTEDARVSTTTTVITLDVKIAAAAATGARTVTVTTSAGSDATKTFTINSQAGITVGGSNQRGGFIN